MIRHPRSAVPIRAVHRALLALACVAGAGAGAACSTDGGGSQAAGATPAGRTGAAGAPGTASGSGGGRTAPSITLAATDVATVSTTTIEDGVALTGDLNPIETVDVRARLEGDLVGVYVREGEQVAAGQLLARFEASEQESGRKRQQSVHARHTVTRSSN